MDDNLRLTDACWKLYAEHCTHARHHETQRSIVAGTFLTIATAIIGLVTFDKVLGLADLPLTLLLVAVGLFGAVFSAKQYERASLHELRARFFREAIDATFAGSPLKTIKRNSDERHAVKFSRLEKLRLNKFWIGLYLLIVIIGCGLSLAALFAPSILS